MFVEEVIYGLLTKRQTDMSILGETLNSSAIRKGMQCAKIEGIRRKRKKSWMS
ncbi:MAG: hypothetical protein H8D26_04110 [Methanomicrobia archaeon]|nr:hypothetical protein [Methanomicrobia archaeon]